MTWEGQGRPAESSGDPQPHPSCMQLSPEDKGEDGFQSWSSGTLTGSQDASIRPRRRASLARIIHQGLERVSFEHKALY